MSGWDESNNHWKYVVKPGDYLSKIAVQAPVQMTWRQLWDTQKSDNPGFMAKRRQRLGKIHAKKPHLIEKKANDPGLIWPDDVLIIKKQKPKEHPKPLDQSHKFILKREGLALTVQLQLDEQPLKDAQYRFQLWHSDDIQSGTTDGKGEVTVDVQKVSEGEDGPVGFGYLRVEIPKNEDFKRYHICGMDFVVFCVMFALFQPKGEPDSRETQNALIARLVNLGYVPGEIDDNLTGGNPHEGLLRLAIRHFYRQHMKEDEDPSSELNDQCWEDVEAKHQV